MRCLVIVCRWFILAYANVNWVYILAVQQPQDNDHDEEDIYAAAPTHEHFSADQSNAFPTTGAFLLFLFDAHL